MNIARNTYLAMAYVNLVVQQQQTVTVTPPVAAAIAQTSVTVTLSKEARDALAYKHMYG